MLAAAGDPTWWETGLENLWSVISTCIDKLTSNTFLAILLVASLVIVGFKVFKRAKKAARS